MKPVSSLHPVGWCLLTQLPEPYRHAFIDGTIHTVPGQFLPAEADVFVQVCLLPFFLLYAFVPLSLCLVLLYELLMQPERYRRFFDTVSHQSPLEIVLTFILALVIAVLLLYMALLAWDLSQSLFRTIQVVRTQRRGQHTFGLLLTDQALVGRLVDNVNGRNCLWLPKAAIQNVYWQRIREEGAKHSRWVYRTRLFYITANGDRHSLTLKGNMVQTGHESWRPESDRALFDTLEQWWRSGG